MGKKKGYKPIRDYGIIGNLDTCALVGKDGSIDWCCFPHIESPSVFAAILDIEKGGHFSIRPRGDYQSEQRYVENTNILESVFKTSSGTVTLTDFFPITKRGKAVTHKTQAIYRRLTCGEGAVEVDISFKPRFDYARATTILEPISDGVIARASDQFLSLKTTVDMTLGDEEAGGLIKITKGEELWFVVNHGDEAPIDLDLCEGAYEDTKEYWEDWVSTCGSQACGFYGHWHEEIVRSSLVLKLLTHHETGAICAAPTTSLPEEIGGMRNWDYRYSWIRDSSFTAQALRNLGHVRDVKNFLSWFMGICRVGHEPEDIQIMYGLHGEMDLEEGELHHLSGYRDSSPVRIGNGAAKQKQLDIYGELLNAFYDMVGYGEEVPSEDWEYIVKIVDHVVKVWNTTDSGIWEVRSEPQHFTYSKLMCWVAVDRGIKIAEDRGLEAPLEVWVGSRKEIKKAILDEGFNKELNSFVQAFGSEVLDATNLLIPMMGLLPYDDPMVQGTIKATLENLMAGNGLVYRYIGEDGLSGEEGAFLLCSFWLVDVLALSDRFEEAEEIFNAIMGHISPLGLFAEEMDPRTGELLGNFPQAFSHIGLVNSALYLGKAKGVEHHGPRLLGHDEN